MSEVKQSDWKIHWHVGNAYGLLNGISLRHDVPADIRKVCKEAVERYQKESDAWDKEQL